MTDTRPYQDPADAPGTLIRSLSRLEAYFTFGYGHFGGHSMLISGELDIQALNDTFIEIQLRHESLRSVIHKDGQIPQFVVGHQPPRPIRIFEGEDLYTRPTGRQAAFDQTQQLVYVDLLTGEDHARVTFFLHHAIADGRHGSALLNEFWNLYVQRVEEGRFPPAGTQRFAQSGEYFLNRTQYPSADPTVKADEALHAPLWDEAALAQKVPPPREPALANQITLEKLGRASLARLSHVESISINSLVSAALIRAHVRSGYPVPIYFYPVDLRDCVTPPVGPTEATNLFSNAWFGDNEIGPDLVTLARKIHIQLDRDLTEGTIHRTRVRNEPTPLLSDKSFTGAVHATHLGRIRIPRLPGNVLVRDITPCFASALGPAMYSFLYGREVTVYTIDSLNQRLRVGFLAGNHEKSDELLGHVEDELTAATGTRI
ncbi:phthiocerol/phthiodiolone dimycocerosyl transferase family protein [Mycobacteroides abscessus]|uniref:phthiocerol/phthiodiolone dimycocerosyl transferase family protein n=1 Tax=Mycobacteroides abscessus TaxID=36809 RepID=UPI0009A8A103|nr:condensation domain-containing protein [Mycobacteroides abscessus]SKI22995.1 Phthiocerol/phthiodiolone dimycocerosyl transferase [Mycobacteroides abscessus subsp. massiliense]